MSTPAVRPATDADRAVLERLWLLFRHDLSEFQGDLPNPDGTFRTERLTAAFTDPDRQAYLLTSDDRPAGFAIVRGLTAPTTVLNTFFVVRGLRRRGAGLAAVRQIAERHPGPWEVAFQDANAAAVRFWRRIATALVGDAWTEERRAVPGRPELPPDVWISFTSVAS
jgi:predicted acetyltransferase